LNYLKLTPWDKWTNVEENTFRKEDLKWLLKFTGSPGGIGGHTTRSYNGYEEVRPDIRYLTFLRDPVKRYISHFQYQNNALGKNWTLDEFLAEERLNNFITKRIAGSLDVDRAKEILERDYLLVGLTERFDESLLMLKKKLDMPGFVINYEKKNVARNTSTRDRLIDDEEAMDRIRKKNTLDLELYDYASKTIFERELENYGDSMDDDLTAFRESNRNYRFSRFRQKWHILYRYGYYKRIEKIGHRRNLRNRKK
jgi:hypothetical protein